MARVLRMPGVSANATEAVLAEWLVAEQAEFAAADALATVETDKALVDVEAEVDGVVLKTLVPPGTQVEVGAPIAVLGSRGEEVADLDALLRELGVAEATDPVVPERRDVPDAAVERAEPDVDPGSGAPVTEEPPSTRGEANGRVFASPLARRMARDAGIPIEEIPGTGPRHRVLRRDVESAVRARHERGPAAGGVVPAAAGPDQPSPGTGPGLAEAAAPYEDVPHSRIRRLTAERLVASKQQAPHFYLRATVRAERLLALREELNDGVEVKVSVNDLVVKAVAAAHGRVPDMNVTWGVDAVRHWRTADVAVAVATDRGLVTPVVRDVAGRGVRAVSEAVRDLAVRAREGRLRQEELEGGSLTVSNLGMYGVEEFAAIINPPHAAILAVGAVRDEPVVEDGAVVPGRVMTLTLSVDHRPVDGVVAARWLAELTGLLERPVRLLA